LLLDAYALSDFHQRVIEEFPGWIITWDSSSVRIDETYYDVADAIRPPSTIFKELHECFPEKFIPFHHIISEEEFAFDDWNGRPYDITVPGVGYVRRKQAIAAINSHGVLRGPKPFPLLMARYLYVGRPNRFRSGVRLLRHYYREQIRRSRISFAEGSGFDIPVRKFLEIPAYGSLLTAIPCNGASDMGLVDGETFIAADQKTIADVTIEMLRDPNRAVRIIRAAQSMIWQNHSQEARMRQFETCFSAIRSGNYAGAEWISGQFRLRGSFGPVKTVADNSERP
jgi:hypothetical protein